jgi:hypothetical protein
VELKIMDRPHRFLVIAAIAGTVGALFALVLRFGYKFIDIDLKDFSLDSAPVA